MAYTSWSVVFGEQPSAAKWNILGTNDASFNDGTGLNVGAIQQIVTTETGTVATGTTLIPIDNTIPQSTEGDQYMTLAITPKSATNLLKIHVLANLGFPNVIQHTGGALFQDSTASALAATSIVNTAAQAGMSQMSLIHKMTAGTTSATTFKFRAGVQISGTLTFNGNSGTQLFGGVAASSIVIIEYKV